MSKIKLTGESSGYVEISAGQNAGNNTLEAPTSGTRLVAHGGSQDVTLNADLSVSGNVSIGGTLTYEDVTNIDSVGIITARAGVNISGGNLQVGGTTVINSGRVLYNLEQLKLADTKQLVLGSSDDLKIYHSGSHSFISEEGAGALKIKGDDIRFENASATEALRIKSDGKVGIGTDSPGQALSISGTSVSLGIYNTGTTHGNVYFYKDGTAKGWLKYRGNDDKLVIGNVTDAINVLTDGKVGLGDATPENTLTIKNIGSFEGDANSFYLGSNFTGTGQNFTGTGKHAQRFFFNNASSNGYLKYENTGTTGNAGDTITWQERFRITSAGNVAINKTSNISAKLHIGDTSNDGALSQLVKLANDSSGSGTGAQINMGAGNGVESTSACIGGFYDGTGTSFIVKTAGTLADQSTVAERLRINRNGCLQVGEPSGTPSEVMQLRKASGDVEVITYAATGSKTIFNCTGSNRFALERGYQSVFEIQDPNGNGVRSDLRFDGNIILNHNIGENNNSAVQAYRLIGCSNVSLANGMAIVGSQTDTMSTKAARIMTSNNSGTAFFGPYGAMHPGSYTAMFHMKVSNNSNTSTFLRIDVSGSGITDAGGYGVHRPRVLNLAPSHFDNADRYQYIGLDFNAVNVVGSNVIEVRGINYNNGMGADLYLDHILIVPRIPSHDG